MSFAVILGRARLVGSLGGTSRVAGCHGGYRPPAPAVSQVGDWSTPAVSKTPTEGQRASGQMTGQD